MRYSISVKARAGSWTTYHRGGYVFDSTAPNLLDESQVNDAMRNDPRLVIEEVAGLPGDEPVEVEGCSPAELLPLGEEPVEYAVLVNDPTDVLPAVRCTGTTRARRPCGAWALEGSDRCRQHPRA